MRVRGVGPDIGVIELAELPPGVRRHLRDLECWVITGRPKRVISHAPELYEQKNGITPFDCPRDNCDPLSGRLRDHYWPGSGRDSKITTAVSDDLRAA
jgi:hypothetical protein